MIVNDCRDGDSLDGVSGNPWNELFVIIVMEIVERSWCCFFFGELWFGAGSIDVDGWICGAKLFYQGHSVLTHERKE